MQCLPKEGHETVKAEEQRSRAFNGTIRPLTLRFDAQMSTPLLKSHFQAPALHEVANDLCCRLGGVGGKNGFRRAFALGITSQNPANRQGIVSGAIPQGGTSTHLQSSLPLSIPVQGEFLPDGFGVLEYCLQNRQALTDDTGTTNGMLGSFWWRLMQDRIQSARSNQGDLLSLCMQSQFQHGVSGIAHQL